VDLIKDNPGVFIEAFRFIQDLIAEYFGGHDQHRGVGIDGHISCKYPYIIPELALEIPVLLVGKSFDGRGVDHAAVILDRGIDDMLGDGGLARSGRGGDDHRVTLVDEINGFLLETVVLHRSIIM